MHVWANIPMFKPGINISVFKSLSKPHSFERRKRLKDFSPVTGLTVTCSHRQRDSYRIVPLLSNV